MGEQTSNEAPLVPGHSGGREGPVAYPDGYQRPRSVAFRGRVSERQERVAWVLLASLGQGHGTCPSEAVELEVRTMGTSRRTPRGASERTVRRRELIDYFCPLEPPQPIMAWRGYRSEFVSGEEGEDPMAIDANALFMTVRDMLSSDLGKGMLGALIGGYLTVVATKVQIRAQSEAAKDAAKEGDAALKRGIEAELRHLKSLHLSGLGEHIESYRSTGKGQSDSEMFDVHYPIFSDYFTLFSSNASGIGRLNPMEGQLVIKAYIDLKAMVDSFRMNNAFLTRLENLEIEQALHPGVTAVRDEILSVREQLDAYGPKVLASHDRAMDSVHQALERLRGV